MDCFYSILALGSFVLAIIALVKSGRFDELQRDLLRLRKEVEELKRKVAQPELAKPEQLAKAATAEAPKPVVPVVKEEPHRITQPIQVQAPKEVASPAPPPIVIAAKPVEPLPEPVVPVALPVPMPALITAAPVREERVVPVPAPTPPVKPAAPTLPKVAEPVTPPPPAKPVTPPPPKIQAPRPEPVRTRTLEDFLGTQIFLKLGIAILVIGVVFAMGLVFQKVGPIGKVLMGYGGGIALLAGGLYAEKRERYRTFGRTLIAGAWGILYFVTYAAGFIEPARIFEAKTVAVGALIIAAAAAVAFSLRYRNEWTTTSAFMLIFLSLGISAFEVHPTFNLTATLIVALAMTVLIWRMGWVKLLGLGVPATWGSFSIWVFTRLEGPAGMNLLLGFAGCWVAFQIATLGSEDAEDHRPWQAFAQIINFLGAMGLTLILTQPEGKAWGWALAYGLAHIAVAWIYFRRGNRGLYLLVSTQAIAALALVTPLRLGLKNQLTPLLRIMGIELLLAAGVFLKERYFRILAYGAFALTVIEILVFKMRPALGDDRLILLGVASAAALLNATLIRTWWRSACSSEVPGVPYAFTVVGTLLAILFVTIKVPLAWMGTTFAALAVAWILLGLLRGLKDLLLEGSVLGVIAWATLLAASFDLPGAPGAAPLRLASSLWGAGLLLLVYGITRSVKGRGLTIHWGIGVAGLFSFLMTGSVALVLIRELPGMVVPPALGGLAVLLLLSGLAFGFRDLVYEAMLAVSLGLATLGTHAWPHEVVLWHFAERTWSILGVVLAAMIQEALFRRGAWKNAILREDERGAGVWGMSLLGSTLLVIAIFLEASPLWIAPVLSALALIHLTRSLMLRHKEHAVISVCIGGAVLFTLISHAWNATGTFFHVSARSFALGLSAIGFMLQEILLQRARDRWPLSLGAWSTLLLGLSHVASVLLVLVIFLEIPAPWIAPLLTAFSLGHLALGLSLRQRNHMEVSFWMSAVVVYALGTESWLSAGTFAHIPLRALSLGLPALGFLLKEVLLRRFESRWPWSAGARTVAGNIHGVMGAAILAVLVFLEAPVAWVSPCFMTLGILWLLWARWRASALHCAESMIFGTLGFIAMATHTSGLQGNVHGIPTRLVSMLGSILLAYALHNVLERTRGESHPDRMLLADHIEPGTLRMMAIALLTLTGLVLGYWIKVEALAHDKNLLVTLAWGLIGVLYLERGRATKAWIWILHGHLGLMAALVHFLIVNVLQTGEVGFISLRLVTGLPFLGLMTYAYLNWPELDRVSEAPATAGRWRHAYLYGAQLAVAMLLLYEPHRAWVLPLWALQALVSLIWGLRTENRHWLRSALILAVACGFRGIGANLYFRDQIDGLVLNQVSVPLASVVLLVGYILLRRRLEGEARLALNELGAGLNRLPWLVVHSVLLFGFIWVEASGPKLTVWLSAFGLGMVALGFAFQERVARLTGLGILSACILKLFLFDLRGLHGLPRVLSFIVLGLVLIFVSYVYTRFKERVEKLL